MANLEHLSILKQGVEAWNQWRRENPAIRPDLVGAKIGSDVGELNLPISGLSGADLHGANLSEAHLIWTNLSAADLSEADLSGSYLYAADLSMADLSRADLSEADLTRADLQGVCFHWANLHNVNLSRATAGGTSFADVDLSAGTDSAKEIREYFIPDFTKWKFRDSYQDAFQRLLRDLKGAKTGQGAAS